MIRHDADLDLLVAGALLDDLDPSELARYEDHQPGCERCAVVVADLGRTLGDLALIARARRPPAALGASISAAIAADRPSEDAGPGAIGASGPATIGDPLPAAAASRPDRSWWPRWSPPRLTPGRRLGPALAAGLVVIIVAVGAWGLAIRADLDRATVEATQARDALARQSRAMAVALAPDHRTARLDPEALAPGADAVVVYRPGRNDAYLVARDLPATPAGSVYQLWTADASGVHGLGTFAFDGSGLFVADFGRDLAGASAVMVTLERAGGASGGPGPQVVFGEL